MIFVDTGAWYALATPSDPDHASAKMFIATSEGPLVTTDYIVDELLTLFVARGQKSKGIEWIHDVLHGGGTRLVRITDNDLDNALRVYQNFADKSWSFTDCTSYAVIERMKLKFAFAFDEHFRQFGVVSVAP